MAGTESRNENSAASSLSIPSIQLTAIVVPLLDMPGVTASPCAMPTIKLLPAVTLPLT